MIGIIGNGFVGNALYQNLKNKLECKVFDINPQRSLNSISETIEQKIIFICLPTPMGRNGSCNLEYINNFFKNLDEKSDSLFVIKSTVPIGTTEHFAKRFKVIHNPEFLTAKNAVNDFKNAERNIVGGKEGLCRQFVDFFEQQFPNIPNIITTSRESEAIKYFANSFLALKVAYFNKVYDTCEKLEMNYDRVRDGITSDSRIGTSHTKISYDGNRGFGGSCFPKDINALIQQMKNLQINPDILTKAWEYNLEIRETFDWEVE